VERSTELGELGKSVVKKGLDCLPLELLWGTF